MSRFYFLSLLVLGVALAGVVWLRVNTEAMTQTPTVQHSVTPEARNSSRAVQSQRVRFARENGMGSLAVLDAPEAILTRAKAVMGFARAGQSVIHYRAVAAVEQNYQSERTYPSFFSNMQVKESWLDPRSGVERVSVQTTYPGSGPSPGQTLFTDANRAFVVSKEQMRLLPRTYMQSRYLNPWNVIADGTTSGNARFVGRQVYRDYSRIVLSRTTAYGEQRLFIDEKSGFPVKVDLQEKHYLWGQRHIEYLYADWIESAGMMIPGASFMLADGKTEISQTRGDVEMIEHEAAPFLPSRKDRHRRMSCRRSYNHLI